MAENHFSFQISFHQKHSLCWDYTHKENLKNIPWFFGAPLTVKRVERSKDPKVFSNVMLFPRIEKSIWQNKVIFPTFLASGTDFNADQSAVGLIMESD